MKMRMKRMEMTMRRMRMMDGGRGRASGWAEKELVVEKGGSDEVDAALVTHARTTQSRQPVARTNATSVSMTTTTITETSLASPTLAIPPVTIATGQLLFVVATPTKHPAALHSNHGVLFTEGNVSDPAWEMNPRDACCCCCCACS